LSRLRWDLRDEGDCGFFVNLGRWPRDKAEDHAFVGVPMSAGKISPNGKLRIALVSSAALAFLFGSAWPGDAAYYYRVVRSTSHAKPAAKKATPEKDSFSSASGVLQLVVSIGSQRVTLFSDGVRVVQGPVSTGMPGHPTAMGVFSIIQKDRYHHSNIYSGAPMPYMQRITWSGVAIHEGVLPGHPASHGCIRTSHWFASGLWPKTRLGVRVIVTRNELTPVDFSHPKLFEPRPKPADPVVTVGEAKPGGLIQLAESTGTSKVDSAMDTPPSTAEPVKPVPTEFEPPKPFAPTGKNSQPAKRMGQVAVFISRKERKIFVRQGFVPMFDMPVEIDEPDRPLGTHVFTALGPSHDGSGMRWNLFTIPTEPRRVAEKPRGRGKSREPVQTVVVDVRPVSTAAEALDRIRMPQAAVDRISELLVPGSSLIVSDLGNSYETGAGTEFVVLTR
jgi:lipoprotein-anchoring transpeptidase ErfK/SrfK